jgi:hypothetical protein
MCGRRKRTSEPKIRYSALARVVRDGGFKTAIIARYSAIPSHRTFDVRYHHVFLFTSRSVTTALFAACGMDFWTFLFAALLSLPKQIASVYIGFALSEAGSGTRLHEIFLNLSNVSCPYSTRQDIKHRPVDHHGGDRHRNNYRNAIHPQEAGSGDS